MNAERFPRPPGEAGPVHAWDRRFARFIYRWRWYLTAAVLAAVVGSSTAGAGRLVSFSSCLTSLGDTSSGSGVFRPALFDPSLDVWFGAEDAAVNTYYEIEDRFIAEDYVMVTFEERDEEFGVFSRKSLSTISRLTEQFLTVPGVRHVRSLTYNPWIRWGEIEDDSGAEFGLIVSDLVEGDPDSLGDAEIIERMVAVLGAERVAERLGADRVRAVLGPDEVFSDHIGEPLLLGTTVDPAGTTTAIQVQILRPRIGEEALVDAFGDDDLFVRSARSIHSVQYQRAALRGIEHFLRLETGCAVPTPEYGDLLTRVESMPPGAERSALEAKLADPTKNFLKSGAGELVRKFYEYDPAPGGKFVDRSDPLATVAAPADFEPQPLSPYSFHLGGGPLFERNFEEVGMADALYIPLMFLVMIGCLFFIFRNVVGVVAPLSVVFGAILAMAGTALALGDLFNNLTIAAPNMLTAVGIADAVHLVAGWAVLRSRYDDKRTLITEVIRRNALPVLLTSITTAVGFYALMASDLEPVYALGYTAGLGTLCAYVLSMTLVPTLLSLVPHGVRRNEKPRGLAAFFTPERSLKFVSRVVRHRGSIIAVSATLTVLAVVGLARVEIDSDFRTFFPDTNPTMSDFNWIEERLGGVGDLEIIFTGVRDPRETRQLTPREDERLGKLRLLSTAARENIQGFSALTAEEERELETLQEKARSWNATRISLSTEFLGRVDAFEARLRAEMTDPDSALHVVTDLLSPLDILRKVHQVQNENRASFYRVPREDDVPRELRRESLRRDEWSGEWALIPAQSGSTLLAQYYLQYENGARPGENLRTHVSADRTRFRIQGRIAQASSAEHRAAFRRIEEIAASEFPVLGARVETSSGTRQPMDPSATPASMTISGKTLLFARTVHVFAIGFTKSMTIALVAITVLIGLIFRSLRLALASLLPVVLPIVVPLGAFGLLGFPLHGPVIFVSSVALGVCVDDTVHLFAAFVRSRRSGGDVPVDRCLAHVFQEIGAPLTITTAVLMIGFGTLLASDFAPNFMMGALATVMIGLAWAADFILTPAVLSFSTPMRAAPTQADDETIPESREREIAPVP